MAVTAHGDIFYLSSNIRFIGLKVFFSDLSLIVVPSLSTESNGLIFLLCFHSNYLCLIPFV